jgi:hypothetical protein
MGYGTRDLIWAVTKRYALRLPTGVDAPRGGLRLTRSVTVIPKQRRRQRFSSRVIPPKAGRALGLNNIETRLIDTNA